MIVKDKTWSNCGLVANKHLKYCVMNYNKGCGNDTDNICFDETFFYVSNINSKQRKNIEESITNIHYE